MRFIECIRELRDARQMPQRQLAVKLEFDIVAYWKIEKEESRSRCEQVVLIADMLNTNKLENNN